ncbi:hypothetical protein IGI04_021356, partial [Brassica rapa subsp. trilocularis]
MKYSMFAMTISHKKFRKALQMFSEFFHCPLFNMTSLEAELTAIENEFELKMLNELIRLEHLKGHTAFESHLFNCFGHGNRNSFKNYSTEELR